MVYVTYDSFNITSVIDGSINRAIANVVFDGDTMGLGTPYLMSSSITEKMAQSH